MRDLLQYVTNIKGLAIIRDAVYELLKERHTVGQVSNFQSRKICYRYLVFIPGEEAKILN